MSSRRCPYEVIGLAASEHQDGFLAGDVGEFVAELKANAGGDLAWGEDDRLADLRQ
jgi:hypothetical protein